MGKAKAIKKTFYDWCIENNHNDYLNRWNYELNNCGPKDVSFSSNKKWWFNCDKHTEHHSEQKLLNSITWGRGSMKCKQCNSFGQWCIDNSHNDLIKRWDYELNSIGPFEVSYMSHSKYYFKCPTEKHKSTLKTICSIVGITDGAVRCEGCDSFGEWATQTFGEIFWADYWDKNNVVDPFVVSKRANYTNIFIKCQEKDYHGVYQTTPDGFVGGRRCPYCGHNKLHILDSLGSVYPQVLDIWSDKNTKTPFEYTVGNDNNIWWKCENNIHKDYRRRVADGVKKEFRCPECVNERTCSILQEKVSTYIIEQYGYFLLHEHQCNIRPINPKTKMPMPYDNEVVDLKLIIEVHGKQHYDHHFYQTMGKSTEKQAKQKLKQRQEYDKYKEDYALSTGYNYLIIPYWTEKDGSYRELIDDAFKNICN